MKKSGLPRAGLACAGLSFTLAGSAFAQSGFLPGGGSFGGAGSSGSWGEPTVYTGEVSNNGMPTELPLDPSYYGYAAATQVGLGWGTGIAVNSGALAYGPEVSSFFGGAFTGLTGDTSISVGVEAATYWGFWAEWSGEILGIAASLLVDANGDQLLTPDDVSDWSWALYEPFDSNYDDYYDWHSY